MSCGNRLCTTLDYFANGKTQSGSCDCCHAAGSEVSNNQARAKIQPHDLLGQLS